MMMMMMMLIERRPLSFVGDLRYRFHSILTTHLPWRLISECKVSRTLHDASCKAFDLGRFLWPAQKVSCWLLHKTNMSLSILCFVYQHLVGATQSWISRWHRAQYDVNPNLNRFQPEGRKNPWTAQPMGSLNILYFLYAVEVCWSFIKPEHSNLSDSLNLLKRPVLERLHVAAVLFLSTIWRSIRPFLTMKNFGYLEKNIQGMRSCKAYLYTHDVTKSTQYINDIHV